MEVHHQFTNRSIDRTAAEIQDNTLDEDSEIGGFVEIQELKKRRAWSPGAAQSRQWGMATQKNNKLEPDQMQQLEKTMIYCGFSRLV